MISSTASRLPVWLKSSSISRRTTALFSSADISSVLLFSPAFTSGLWLHSYIVEPREAQHMSQMHYFCLLEGTRFGRKPTTSLCLYILETGFPAHLILGN